MELGFSVGINDRGYSRFKENKYVKMKEHGYKYLDLDLANTESPVYTLPQNEADAFLLKEKEATQSAGLEIYQVHGPWRWPPLDDTEERLKERMEKMKYGIRATAVLGCKYFVIHPIMPFGIEEKDTENEKLTYEYNIRFMKELLATAKEFGVVICLENMPFLKFSLSRPRDILRVVEEMNDENFKICLDTGHANVFEDYFGDVSLTEDIRFLGDKIAVLHVHDNRHAMDLHSFPYFGTINWKGFMESLRDIDFKGSFSLETLPPVSLPDDIFEKQCELLADIAKELLNI